MRHPYALLALVFALSLGLAGQARAQDTLGFDSFVRSLNTEPYGYLILPDPTESAPSSVVERFEVRPGDCGAEAGGWDDCATDRERSELSEKGTRAPAGSEYWYGFSLQAPADFPDISPTKTTLGQFHQENSHVVFLFNVVNGSYVLDDQRTGRTAKLYPLIPASELRDRWHRILVQARWSADSDGFLKVYVNGVLKVSLVGNTAPAGTKVYLKYGVYRAFVSRYKNVYGVPPPTQIAHYTRLRKGRTRADVE